MKNQSLNLDEYLPFLINRVGITLVSAFSAELTNHQISVPMWRVLAVLHQAGEQRQIDLVNLTSIEESTLSRIVTTLARKKMVSRRKSITSNRERLVALTAKGRAVTGNIIPLARAYEGAMIEGMNENQLEATKTSLRQFYLNLDSWLDKRFSESSKGKR